MSPDFKPYLLRAVYEWCADQGWAPYLAVAVDSSCRVPMAHVRKGQIVFDISMQATGQLDIAQDAITFQARFGGIAHNVFVPMHRVLGLFPERNQAAGTFFEVTEAPTQGKVEKVEKIEQNIEKTAHSVARPRFSRVK